MRAVLVLAVLLVLTDALDRGRAVEWQRAVEWVWYPSPLERFGYAVSPDHPVRAGAVERVKRLGRLEQRAAAAPVTL